MPLTYDIIECNNLEDDTENKNLVKNIKDEDFDIDTIVAMKTDYNLNYNLSYLNNIADYYQIKKNGTKKTKNYIIDKIVDFEIDKRNKNMVVNRKRMFSIFQELKNDKFFTKFVIGSL